MLTAIATMLVLAQAAPGGAPPQTAPRNPPPMKRIERHLPGPTRNDEPRQKFEDDPANPTPASPGEPTPAAAPAPAAAAAPADPAAPAAPVPPAAEPTPDAAPAGPLPAGAMTPRPAPAPAPAAAAAAPGTTGFGTAVSQVFLLLMLAPMTLGAAWAVGRGTGTSG